MFNIFLPFTGIEINFFLLISIGFLVGVLGGFFGVGGAWIATPALNIFGFPMPYAIGTDFAQIFGKSIVATTKHSKMGNVDFKLGLTTMIGTLPGVEIGSQLVIYLEELGKKSGTDIIGVSVRWTYIIMLFLLSFFMFYDYLQLQKTRKKFTKLSSYTDIPDINKRKFIEKLKSINLPPYISYPKSNITKISVWYIFVIFFICGFVSGFLGVGGGFIRMPSLIYLIGCPTALAVGTDLFIVMIDGAYGCFSYAIKGRVEVIAAIIMLLGAAIGAQIGVIAVKYIRGYSIRLLFAFMILFAAISISFKQFASYSNNRILNEFSGIILIGCASIMSLVIISMLIYNYKKEAKIKIT